MVATATDLIKLEQIITSFFADIASLKDTSPPAELVAALDTVLDLLNNGKVRVAAKVNGVWQVNTWLKQAILLYMVSSKITLMDAGYTQFLDKVPAKFSGMALDEFASLGVRVSPPSYARYGCYIANACVLMTSFVNIGAYVDTGCMLDSFSLVGSCAQVGKNVHLAAGAGLGGVLEPLQAAPVIVEDNCFIGAGSWILEGVVVEAGAVIASGLNITQSTKIYDRERDAISFGKIPAGSVVVPGALPDSSGKCMLQCAVIVKKIDIATKNKTDINTLLRNI